MGLGEICGARTCAVDMIYDLLYCVVRVTVLILALPNLYFRADLATSLQLCTHHNTMISGRTILVGYLCAGTTSQVE